MPPRNAYARLFQLVAGLREEIRANHKGKSTSVSQDLERLGKRPLTSACYAYTFSANFHMPKFHEYNGITDPIQHLNHSFQAKNGNLGR
ncbi:hypothetical protein FRX31_021434 [Thalictrum thalictroides]|uniref:Uncharacterized protein n=1 Tax=Thalictrum thalictroides TaxID=46969 RepID=A0A7J6VV61_THATH|nr:hypothetical protein FRX31_021434 [Thalictrum thalictroides]